MKGDEDDMIKMLHNFFTVSLNVSFATHPNYRECEDPTCSPVINKGITIKYDANMHYATTALSSAVFQDLCKQAGIPFQKETSHSDFRTGRTISAFLQTQTEMRWVKVGIPCWAMHSSRESCGTKDFYNLIRFLVAFWKHPIKNTVNYPYHKQDISSLILKEMNFKLTNLAAINEKYGRTMEQLQDTTWEVCTNSCGCSGDCGSNWIRS